MLYEGSKKILYLLGAGFTHALTGGKSPLTAALGEEIGSLFSDDIKNKYNFSPEKIEQFLTVIDLEIKDILPLIDPDRSFFKSNSDKSRLYLQRIKVTEKIYELFRTSNFCSKLDKGIDITDPASKVSNLLFKQNDTILTTNYDCYLENLLWTVGKWSPDNGGYGASLCENKENLTPSSERGDKLIILKLHGSLNFYIKDVGTNRHIYTDIGFGINQAGGAYSDFPGERLGEEYYNSGGNIKEYIVVPSYVKIFEYKTTLQIWREAFLGAQKANALVMIGSSLRDEDYLLWFLLSMLPKKTGIFIIDPNASAIGSKIKDHFLTEFQVFEIQQRIEDLTESQANQIYS